LFLRKNVYLMGVVCSARSIVCQNAGLTGEL